MKVVVVGPGPRTQGGIASVNRVFSALPEVESIYSVNSEKFRRHLFSLFSVFRYLWVIQSASVVHIHTSTKWGFWRKAGFVWLAHMFAKPVVLHVHPFGFWPWFENLPPGRRRIVSQLISPCKSVLVLSERARLECKRLTGIDAEVLSNFLPDFDASPGERIPNRFVFLGWIVPEKGIAELITACNRLAHDGFSFELVIAGNKRVEWLRALIAQYNLSGTVRFVGWVDGKAKNELLATAAALVLPSYSEGMPMVALESVAAGTLGIFSTVGAIPEVFEDKKSALLIRPQSADEVYTAMRWVLEHPGAALRIGRAARLDPRFLSKQAYIERIRELWRKAAE